MALPMRNLRTTASLMPTTSPSSPKRSLLLVLVSLRRASLTRAASKTRNGPMPNLSVRRRKKTSLLDQAERLSVSASVSKSSSSKLTNALSKPPSVADVVDPVVVAVVEMARPAEAEENSVDVVIEAKAAVAVTEVPHAEPTEVILAVHLSTRTTPVLSPAWDHRLSAQTRSSLIS